MNLVQRALEERRACREQFELYRQEQYDRAIDECNGVLLNRRGEAAGVSSYSLFMGSAVRANAYASDELVEFWRRHGRLTFADFEAAWPWDAVSPS